MPYIPKVKVGSTEYDVKDSEARELIMEAIRNKIVISSFIDGGYVDYNDGNVYPIPNYSYTNYLPIPDRIETTAAQNSSGCIAFYDSNHHFVGATKQYNNFIPPIGSVYFRVTNYNLSQANPTVTLYYLEKRKINNALFGTSLFLEYEATHEGFFLDTTDGIAKAHSLYKCSDYIDIQGGRPIIEAMPGPTDNGFAFYDDEKNFISAYKTFNYSVPQNARYMRFGTLISNVHAKVYLPVHVSTMIEEVKTFKPSVQGYIDYTENGNFYNHAKYKTTDFIPVPSRMTTTCVQQSNACLAFYDRNLSYISATKNYNSIEIPHNAVYFRISDYDENNEQSGTVTCYYNTTRNASQSDSVLSGKKLVFIGDSLTAVYYKNENESWPALIAARNGATSINLGVSGSPIAEKEGYSDRQPMCDRLNAVPNDADYIMLMGGNNDFNIEVPIGSNTDAVKTTFKGALNYTINYLITNYPNAKLIFATLYRRDEDRNDEIYATAMKEICDLWCVPCVDNYHCSGVHFFNEAWMTIHGAWTWTGDESQKMTNKHLNAEGDAFVSTIFEAALKSI